MAVDIGKMNVTLSANSAPFTAALGKAEAAVQGWGSSITKTLLSVTSIGAGLSLPGLFGGASAIVKENQAAKQMGLSLTEMRVATKLAGPAAEQLAEAMGNLNSKLHGAQMGSLIAREDLAGLAAITGKSAGSLQGGGPLGLVEAISGISDPAIKAGQAFRFLGDSALPFLDQLRAGGVGGARDFIRRMGLEVSGADLQSMREMAKVMFELKAVGAGVFNQVLLGIAPVVAEIAKGFESWKLDLSGLRLIVQGLAEGMARFVGLIGQGAGDTKLIALSFDYVWKQAERGWLNLEALMLQGLAKMADAFAGTLPSATGNMRKMLKGVGMGDTQTAAAAQLKYDAYLAIKGAELAGDQAAALMGRMRGQFARNASSPEADAEKARRELFLKSLNQEFTAMRGGLGNPLSAFTESMTKIGLFGEAGLFAGTGGLRGRLGFKAGMDLLGAAGMAGGPQFAGAAEANTREAYSAIGRFEFEGKRGGIQDQIKAAIESLIKVQERQAATGDQMLLATQDIKSSSGKAAELLAGGGGL